MAGLLWLLSAAAAPAVIWLYWRARHGPPSGQHMPILAYHKIDSRFEPGITRCTPGQFHKQIWYLASKRYTVVPLTRLVDSIRSGVPLRERSVVITFDDGFASLYRHAYPLLLQQGMTATVFLVTGHVGGKDTWDVNFGWGRFEHLSWSQVREMHEHGFCFGSHTVTHPDLTVLNARRLRWELDRSRKTIEDRLGTRVSLLSYPFGRLNRRVRRLAQETGYEGAVTLCPSGSNACADVYGLRRSAVYLIDGLFSLRVKLEENRYFWIEDMKARFINSLALGTPLLRQGILEPFSRPYGTGGKGHGDNGAEP